VITDRFFQNTFFNLIYLINKVLKNLHEIYLSFSPSNRQPFHLQKDLDHILYIQDRFEKEKL
jgi:hypothetical protein